ncbi:glutamate--tRNA ligase [Candidatus Woesearchaeota archaeon]|nr:glutamate--tRNA ligase [Candidatus Woesearchaeota archaeon]
MELEDKIRIYALDNARKFNGKANPGAVMGKIFGEFPQWRGKAKELSEIVMPIIADISKLSVEEQVAELMQKAPEVFEKKEKEERNIFAFLNIQEGEKIVTAFPPGPEKHPHIGHAKSLLLNYLLARQYNGEFKLRFEDTNPKLVKNEYYEIMQKDFKWLGVEWDDLDYASDHMELYYSHALRLIEKGQAYMCDCAPDDMREKRQKGEGCGCRERSVEEHTVAWNEFPTYEEGRAVLRLKLDMSHKNSTMRDPTIFRVIRAPHARHDEKYTVWPNYDFQTSIMDGHKGVTHRIRSKEFEMRSELQRTIQNMLGYSETRTFEVARFNMKGVPSSGRMIREMLEKGELIGWDDPKLTTIAALRRRGFTPESIKNFVISTGMTKSEATLTWDDLIVHNKRLLDAHADRYFFVHNPVQVEIEGAPKLEGHHKLHPDKEEKPRVFDTDRLFFMSPDDFENLKDGQLYRFMDLLNFRKEGASLTFVSTDVDDYKKEGKGIMHYLPVDDHLVKVEVLMPDHQVVLGVAEPLVHQQVKVGDIIQFERFGFVRLDSVEDEVYKFWFTHK